MPYIKIPEFKHGDVVSAGDFNSAREEIQNACETLDGVNFKDESLGMEEVPEDVSLNDNHYGDRVKHNEYRSAYGDISHGSKFGILDPLHRSSHSPFPVQLNDAVTWPFRNRLQLLNMQIGEKVLIRASFRIQVPDMGARTYLNGKPSVVKVGLMRFNGFAEELDAIATGSTAIKSMRMITPTEQRFRFAFTDKMPSASSLSKEAYDAAGATYVKIVTTTEGSYEDTDPMTNNQHLARDSGLGSDWSSGLWYRDNRGPNDEDKNPSDTADAHDPRTDSTLNFPAQFNYTIAHVYEHGKILGGPPLADHPVSSGENICFVLCCYVYGFDAGMESGPVPGESVGGWKGCYRPFRQPVMFRDCTVTCHPVRR